MASSSVWIVYLARCADGSLYVGRTTNLASREKAHNDGHGATYTAARRPVRIVFAEQHATMRSAIARERQLKHWTAAKKEALIAGRVRTLKTLSERRSAHKQVIFRWKDLMKMMSDV